MILPLKNLAVSFFTRHFLNFSCENSLCFSRSSLPLWRANERGTPPGTKLVRRIIVFHARANVQFVVSVATALLNARKSYSGRLFSHERGSATRIRVGLVLCYAIRYVHRTTSTASSRCRDVHLHLKFTRLHVYAYPDIRLTFKLVQLPSSGRPVDPKLP